MLSHSSDRPADESVVVVVVGVKVVVEVESKGFDEMVEREVVVVRVVVVVDREVDVVG